MDTGLGDINTNDTDNSDHIIHEILNDINDVKRMNNSTNLSTNGTVTKTKEKSVSILANESNKQKEYQIYTNHFNYPNPLDHVYLP